MRACGPSALKPYWGKPAVRNFRGACGNGATDQAIRARSRKRRTRPSLFLRVTAPCVYSTILHVRIRGGRGRATSRGYPSKRQGDQLSCHIAGVDRNRTPS